MVESETRRVCMTFWSKWGKRVKPLILLGIILALPLVMMRVPGVRKALVDLVAFMRAAPLAGAGLFFVIEAIAFVLTVPVWIMSGLAGYAYGFERGLLVAWPAVISSASVVFLVGRTFARKWVAARSSEMHYWKAVNRAVQKDGFKVTLLMRLAVALPQNLISYTLSATSLRLRDFVLGSMLGYIPATLVHVYVGANVDNAAAFIAGESANRGPWAWVTAVLGGVLTVSMLVLISRHARKVLDEALAEAARSS